MKYQEKYMTINVWSQLCNLNVIKNIEEHTKHLIVNNNNKKNVNQKRMKMIM